MKNIKISIVGKSPLLMHSPQLANPLDPASKEHKKLTGKRKKTDDDYIAMARNELIYGSYWSKESGFFVPGANLDACLWNAAKLQKLGVKYKQGAMVLEDELPLLVQPAKVPQDLWEIKEHVDMRFVVVSRGRIMRCRPIFRQWALKATVVYNPDILNHDDVEKVIKDSGSLIGLGDYRPRFGRFEVTIE